MARLRALDRWGGADPIPREGLEAAERELWTDVPYGGLGVTISDGFWYIAGPFLEATVGRRPWIEAACADAPVTMVWRLTGRRPVAEAIDEVADALAHGETRPTPLSARWVGYDRRGVRLARKG